MWEVEHDPGDGQAVAPAPAWLIELFTSTPPARGAARRAPSTQIGDRPGDRFNARTTWPDAYTYRFPGGEIGPVAGRDARAAARALEAELARADGSVRLRLPGSSRALVQIAFSAGLRLDPVPGLLLLSEGVQPPTALAIGGYPLF